VKREIITKEKGRIILKKTLEISRERMRKSLVSVAFPRKEIIS